LLFFGESVDPDDDLDLVAVAEAKNHRIGGQIIKIDSDRFD
jgi:hypothetical protein